jgi:predicted ATP-binding protein involved in virulence
MIKKVEVKGLYDVFDHTIELKDHQITLILGENGLGKTIILKMINSFFKKNYNSLFSYPYQELKLTFVSNEVISISKKTTEDHNALLFELENPKEIGELYSFELPISRFNSRRFISRPSRTYYGDYSDIDIRGLSHEIEFYINRRTAFQIERIGSQKWIDHSNGKLFSTKELLHRFRDILPDKLVKALDTNVPDWLTDKSDSFDTTLIETQRLLYRSKESESEYKNSVIKYAQELTEKIKDKTVEATGLASKLDKNYPNRVVEEIKKKDKISNSEIKSGLEKLSKRRELLNKVGLIDTEEEHLQATNNMIPNEQKNRELLNIVLQVYINDSNEKLEVYTDLAKKLEVLIDIINKRFLHKTLSISKRNGFEFKSTITNKSIPLDGLSSGEQHVLVLFYQLLFNTSKDSLLLIDEPEISLHISWQNHFIDDLREIININNFSALIATHSPDIINHNWDLTVTLNGK